MLEPFLLELEQLSQDAAEVQLRELEATCDSPAATPIDFLKWAHTGLFLGNAEACIRALSAMRERLDTLLDNTGSPDTPLKEAVIDWNLLALRFVQSTVDAFDEAEHFLEIIDITNEETGRLAARHWQTRLAFLSHFVGWLSRGGAIEALPDQLQQFLRSEADTLTDEVEARIAEFRPSEPELATILQRSLTRFYVDTQQTEAALECYQVLLNELLPTSGLTTAEQGEFYLEAGQLIAQLGDLPTARNAVFQAILKFTEAGEAYEVQLAQAEGWYEELAKLAAQK